MAQILESLNAMGPVFGAVWLFIIGACFGSFANVWIYRWPKEQSVVRPRSHCMSCQSPIRWSDNIPIFSYLILRGRCRQCGTRFSARYMLVEVLTAVLCAAAFLKFGWSFALLEAVIFIFMLVTVTFIDIDHFLLPDVFTLSGIAIGFAGSFLSSQRTWLDSGAGIILGGGFLWSLAYFYFLIRKEEGMGGGDIKLLAWIGAVLGWQAVPFVILSSSVVGSLAGLWAARRQKAGLKSVIPFGPYLAFGAVLYLFAGESLAHAYISWLIPSLD